MVITLKIMASISTTLGKGRVIRRNNFDGVVNGVTQDDYSVRDSLLGY